MLKKLVSSSTQQFSQFKLSTVFDKIINKQAPSKIVYEDEKCLAFHDIAPQAPTHILLIPKQPDGLTQLSKAEDRHQEILGYLMIKAAQIAKSQNLNRGWRLVINDGIEGGGTQMKWPPGTK